MRNNLTKYLLYLVLFFSVAFALYMQNLKNGIDQKYEQLDQKYEQLDQKYENLFTKSGILTNVLRRNNEIIDQSYRNVDLCNLTNQILNNSDFSPNIPYFLSSENDISYNFLDSLEHKLQPVLIIPQIDFNFSPIEINAIYPNIKISIITKSLNSKIKPYDFFIIYSNLNGDHCKTPLRLYLASSPKKIHSPLNIFGRIGNDYGQFSVPYGSDIDQDSKTIFITDCTNNLVQEFDFQGNLISILDNQENNGFMRPTDIKLVGDEVYIIDELKGQLDIFDREGGYIKSVGSINPSLDPLLEIKSLMLPISFAVNPDGNVFVIDYETNRILKFGSSGDFIKVIGGAEKFDGKALDAPYYADYYSDLSRLYVNDRGNNRIVVFDDNGDFLFSFGSFGVGEGQFDYPHEIEITSDGHIYVADTNNYRIQIFDINGNYINKIDTGKGFDAPKTVSVSNSGLVMIGHIGEEAYITSWVSPISLVENDSLISSVKKNKGNIKFYNKSKKSSSNSTYEKYCSSCHTEGIFGAPKSKSDADWEKYPRDIITLLSIVKKGEGSMQPLGGCLECSDDELIIAIEYMLPKIWGLDEQNKNE